MSSDDGVWLPPGQAVTGKFPVVGETAPAAGLTAASYRLQVGGLVEKPLSLSLAQVLALPQHERSSDIHCVTGWSRRTVSMRGVPLASVLRPLGVAAAARYVRFVAHSTRAHDTSLPLELALRETWLVRIELLAQDSPGYWERESAYHNDADPWREQRFDEAQVAGAEQVQAFRAAADFAPYRGRVLLKARLGGWQPLARDLSGLQLKYCSFRKARLEGVDFRGANLSLSNFEGADLRGCDFSGADLEGVSFAGADLRGARMAGVALSAARFYRDFAGGRRLAAQVEGLRLSDARGLLEDQAAFLRAAGVLKD
jgi:hypothetical protein